jgi:5'-nucleotidase
MSQIGYDAATLGNHEFDNGVAPLAAAMRFAGFDIVSSNYDVKGTVLEKRVKRYVVRDIAGVRIGLFGLGVSPEALITPDNFKGITYLDPVETARSVVKDLKEKEGCSLILCMSHLGYYKVPKGREIGDSQVSAQVDGIDFIASGHTHTFMTKPVIQKQPSGKDTIIFQVGKAGINLGRVDFTMRAGQVTAWAGHLLDLRDESLS